MKRVTVMAPAKVNLYLAVGESRPDGYHDVVTVLHSLALADEVIVEPAGELALSCEPDLDLPAEENLAWRAALAAGAALGRPPAYAIRVRKAIPARAGLGGGSADAAAVLRAAARLEGVDPLDPRMMRAAATLGADVPFLLRGGAALLVGRGDALVRTLPPLSAPVVVAAPGTFVPTPSAYAAFDRISQPPPPEPDLVTGALEAGDVSGVSRNLYNNLTEASLTVAPAIGEVLEAMRSCEGVLGVLMAGSGSAVFGLAESRQAAVSAADALRGRGWWAAATETSSEVMDSVEEDQ